MSCTSPLNDSLVGPGRGPGWSSHAGEAASGEAAGAASGAIARLAADQAGSAEPNHAMEAATGTGSRTDASPVVSRTLVWSVALSLN